MRLSLSSIVLVKASISFNLALVSSWKVEADVLKSFRAALSSAYCRACSASAFDPYSSA